MRENCSEEVKYEARESGEKASGSTGKLSRGRRIGGETAAEPEFGVTRRPLSRYESSSTTELICRKDLDFWCGKLRQDDGHCLETGDSEETGESVSGVFSVEDAELDWRLWSVGDVNRSRCTRRTAPPAEEETYELVDMLGVTCAGGMMIGDGRDSDSDNRR